MQGTGQALDHVFVSSQLAGKASRAQVVHVNTGLAETLRVSDHDPILAEISLAEREQAKCATAQDCLKRRSPLHRSCLKPLSKGGAECIDGKCLYRAKVCSNSRNTRCIHTSESKYQDCI